MEIPNEYLDGDFDFGFTAVDAEEAMPPRTSARMRLAQGRILENPYDGYYTEVLALAKHTLWKGILMTKN